MWSEMERVSLVAWLLQFGVLSRENSEAYSLLRFFFSCKA